MLHMGTRAQFSLRLYANETPTSAPNMYGRKQYEPVFLNVLERARYGDKNNETSNEIRQKQKHLQ